MARQQSGKPTLSQIRFMGLDADGLFELPQASCQYAKHIHLMSTVIVLMIVWDTGIVVGVLMQARKPTRGKDILLPFHEHCREYLNGLRI